MSSTLVVSDLTREIDNKPIFANINFSLDKGDILFVRGPSGVGKSVLLRSLAALDPIQGGTVTLNNATPLQLGPPHWRAAVTYVHQTRVPLKGTPEDLFDAARALTAHRTRPSRDLAPLFEQVGLDADFVHKPWTQLSGGQAQRAYIALCVALQPDVLLLDEPTSACDAASAQRYDIRTAWVLQFQHISNGSVESVLKASGAALVWVTHDEEQPQRVGGSFLKLPEGTIDTIDTSIV